MKCHFFLGAVLAGLFIPAPVSPQTPQPGKNVLVIRGQAQEIYFYPRQGQSLATNAEVLFAPGDLGMHGFAVTIAATIASWGYDVCGLDTRHYLESFTGVTTLKVTDVASDFREIAPWMTRQAKQRVALVGWSEGAGLCLLAAASEEGKKSFSILITLGMTESNVLGWRWSDYFSYLTKKEPKEPTFQSIQFLPQVAPLPLVMIQATGDQYISVEAARQLFSVAKEPKRFALVEARNHRFEGNQEELFRVLREGLGWISKTTQ